MNTITMNYLIDPYSNSNELSAWLTSLLSTIYPIDHLAMNKCTINIGTHKSFVWLLEFTKPRKTTNIFHIIDKIKVSWVPLWIG